MAKYLMRFDDINARMDWDRFFTIKKVLEKYDIKSILGVVPKCEDKSLEVGKINPYYIENLKKYSSYGDVIAQHGYKHLYDSELPGLFGNSPNSEFAGNSYKKQFTKLSKGKKILKKESLWTPVFMAPNHSFDLITLKVLKKLKFETVLDGFSILPFKKNNLNFIPQISSNPLPIFFPGLSQLCIHINTISESNFEKLILFIEKNHTHFIKLEDINPKNNFLTLFDRNFISLSVKLNRSIKKIFNVFKYIFLKSRCIAQRIIYRIKFRNIEIYKWHLSGTFYCRNYKIQSLKIINSLKPDIYIDIGCGLGEILNKVSLSSKYKLGYDSDLRLVNTENTSYKKYFKFFTDEDALLNEAIRIKKNDTQKIVFSMLGFSHLLSKHYLKTKLQKYSKIIGKYTLLIDNIYVDSKEYKYNHHNFFYKHNGFFRYFHKVDQLRSLYCIEIG